MRGSALLELDYASFVLDPQVVAIPLSSTSVELRAGADHAEGPGADAGLHAAVSGAVAEDEKQSESENEQECSPALLGRVVR